MTLSQLILAYNIFSQDIAPEMIEDLLASDLTTLTVADNEMLKLLKIALTTGEAPTTRDFIAARDIIGF